VAPPGWKSDGREPWVYRADVPGDLLGVHADLIGSALRPRETLHCLLYAPIWEGTRTPFGITARPGSHAVAITDDRILVSEDLHSPDASPVIRAIPFNRVLAVEHGHALLLGWFVVRYAEGGRLSTCPLLYRATGGHHFVAAVRAYRRLVSNAKVPDPAAPATSWHAALAAFPSDLETLLWDVLLSGERPLGVVRSKEAWSSRKRRIRRSHVCVSTPGAFIATSHGLLHVRRAAPSSPGALNFGVNVSCTPPDVAVSTAMVESSTDGPSHLLLRVTRSSATLEFRVPFPSGEEEAAVALADRLAIAHSPRSATWTS